MTAQTESSPTLFENLYFRASEAVEQHASRARLVLSEHDWTEVQAEWHRLGVWDYPESVWGVPVILVEDRIDPRIACTPRPVRRAGVGPHALPVSP